MVWDLREAAVELTFSSRTSFNFGNISSTAFPGFVLFFQHLFGGLWLKVLYFASVQVLSWMVLLPPHSQRVPREPPMGALIVKEYTI